MSFSARPRPHGARRHWHGDSAARFPGFEPPAGAEARFLRTPHAGEALSFLGDQERKQRSRRECDSPLSTNVGTENRTFPGRQLLPEVREDKTQGCNPPPKWVAIPASSCASGRTAGISRVVTARLVCPAAPGLPWGGVRPARPDGRNSTFLLSGRLRVAAGAHPPTVLLAASVRFGDRLRGTFCGFPPGEAVAAHWRGDSAARFPGIQGVRSLFRFRLVPGAGTLYQNIPARWPDAWKVSNSSSPVREPGGTYPPRRGGREPTLFGIPPKNASFLQSNSATERKESMPFYFGTCKSFTQYSPQTPFRLCGYRRTHRPDGFSAGKGAARTENTGVNRRISAFIFSSSIPVRLRP